MYSRTNLKTNIATLISGVISDTDLNTILNRAVLEVVSDSDIRSCIRRSALSPNLFDDIYQYTAPTDLKGRKIIDIEPQVGRGHLDDWRFTTAEEFDRYKQNGESLVAVRDSDMVKKILISKSVDDTSVVIEPLSALGTWLLFGDGTNVTADSSNYVKGSASINWDISAAGGTTAGIQNSAITSLDISEYLSEGSIFIWTYITSITYLTNFILRIGSSSSAYNYITATTNNEGTAFVAGWNLLRFDLINLTATGTPTNTACTYVALYMTKNALKISETDYRFNYLVLKKGVHNYLVYYSKYGWQSSTGTYLENSTADTDYVNADSDELRLIEYKASELGEVHLRSSAQTIKEKRDLYENYSAKYKAQYPSLSLPLIITYNEMNYL